MAEDVISKSTFSTQGIEIVGDIIDELISNAEPLRDKITGNILEEILNRADINITLREIYKDKCATHNQFALFNLLDMIYNFEIDDMVAEELTFQEQLIIGLAPEEEDGTIKPLGGICIDVQKAEGRIPDSKMVHEYEQTLIKVLDNEGIADHLGGQHLKPPCADREDENHLPKFVVHMAAQMDYKGSNGGYLVTTWADRNLHTLEELRKEFIMDSDGINEQTLYTALKKGWYYVKHTESLSGADDRKLYSVQKARDYVSEGANIILHRYLAIHKYQGSFELACAYINGDLCRNIYECSGPEQGLINDQYIEVCHITRTVIEECGFIHITITIMTTTGRILKQEWQDCNIILYVNPKIDFLKYGLSKCPEIPLKNTWQDDLQLMSAYLDVKDENKLKNKSYMLDHPELKDMMADYLNTILLLKPQSVIEFTMKYFNPISIENLPKNDYFE